MAAVVMVAVTAMAMPNSKPQKEFTRHTLDNHRGCRQLCLRLMGAWRREVVVVVVQRLMSSLQEVQARAVLALSA